MTRRRLVRKTDRKSAQIAARKVQQELGKAMADKALRDLGEPSTAEAIGWRAVDLGLITKENQQSVRRRAHQLVEQEIWYWWTDGRHGGDLIWIDPPPLPLTPPKRKRLVKVVDQESD